MIAARVWTWSSDFFPVIGRWASHTGSRNGKSLKVIWAPGAFGRDSPCAWKMSFSNNRWALTRTFSEIQVSLPHHAVEDLLEYPKVTKDPLHSININILKQSSDRGLVSLGRVAPRHPRLNNFPQKDVVWTALWRLYRTSVEKVESCVRYWKIPSIYVKAGGEL